MKKSLFRKNYYENIDEIINTPILEKLEVPKKKVKKEVKK